VDLPALVEGVFRAAQDNIWHRLIVASLVSAGCLLIVAGLSKLWRRRIGISAKRKGAAKALRDQGEYHTQLKHRHEAMELYDLSVHLNSRDGHVYYLRGCLHAELGDPNAAIADWKRCLARFPGHPDAKRRLTELGGLAPPLVPGWAYLCGVGAVILLLTIVGISTR